VERKSWGNQIKRMASFARECAIEGEVKCENLGWGKGSE